MAQLCNWLVSENERLESGYFLESNLRKDLQMKAYIAAFLSHKTNHRMKEERKKNQHI